jgi:hypothetical protein
MYVSLKKQTNKKIEIMLITKEQQEALVEQYMKNHNADECNGFIDGMVAMLDLIIKLENNKNK